MAFPQQKVQATPCIADYAVQEAGPVKIEVAWATTALEKGAHDPAPPLKGPLPARGGLDQDRRRVPRTKLRTSGQRVNRDTVLATRPPWFPLAEHAGDNCG